jgi:putative hydrolase of the HAD superfamily
MGIKAIFFDIGNTLVSKKQWLPGSKEFVLAMRQNKVRVGLISNTGDLDREALAKLLPPDFDFGLFEGGLTLLSSEIGIEKPDIGMFLLAVEHTRLSPWETMFVGESLTETLAAQRAGMQTARIANPKSDYAELLKFLS